MLADGWGTTGRCRGTWRDHPVAGRAFGGKVVAVAVAAHQRVALAAERLVRQRALAAEAAEAAGVVMSVLVEELLRRRGRTVRRSGNSQKGGGSDRKTTNEV